MWQRMQYGSGCNVAEIQCDRCNVAVDAIWQWMQYGRDTMWQRYNVADAMWHTQKKLLAIYFVLPIDLILFRTKADDGLIVFSNC